MGTCAGDAKACRYEESEGEKDVVGGCQGFGGGVGGADGVVVRIEWDRRVKVKSSICTCLRFIPSLQGDLLW